MANLACIQTCVIFYLKTKSYEVYCQIDIQYQTLSFPMGMTVSELWKKKEIVTQDKTLRERHILFESRLDKRYV